MLIRMLHEHRVLTTPQVADVGFSTYRLAQRRLETLYALRIVDRFRPLSRAGSSPFHWVLDEAGASVIAAERGVEVNALPWRRERALALETSASLAHRVGTNGFFTALLRESRCHPGRRLATWWPEWRCAAAWGRVARPDGYGVWLEAGERMPFLLEYDCGTETGARLAEKLPGYRDLATVAVSPTWLLFRFPTPRREVEARRALASAPPLTATAALLPGSSPAAAVWLPVGGTRRLRLAELAGLAAGERCG